MYTLSVVHHEAGALGRELRDKSRAWLNKNFASVAAEPAFLQLPAAEVISLLEEEVFAAVMAWVKEGEVGKGELNRLLPLVRFPMMAKPAIWWSRWWWGCSHSACSCSSKSRKTSAAAAEGAASAGHLCDYLERHTQAPEHRAGRQPDRPEY